MTNISIIIPIFPDQHMDYTNISGPTYRLYRYFRNDISITLSVFQDRHFDYTHTADKTDADTDTDVIDKRYPILNSISDTQPYYF